MGLGYGLKNNKAFSLLELIITIAILSIGIIVVLQALSTCARAVGFSCDIIDAVFLAEDKIQELEFKEKQNLISKEPKEIREKKEKFAWGYSLSLEPDFNLYRLKFDITWQRLNREEKLELETYLR